MLLSEFFHVRFNFSLAVIARKSKALTFFWLFNYVISIIRASHPKTSVMKTITSIALLLPLISFCQYNLNGHYLDYDKQPSTDQLKKFTYENLRLYPIIAKDSFKLAFKNL